MLPHHKPPWLVNRLRPDWYPNKSWMSMDLCQDGALQTVTGSPILPISIGQENNWRHTLFSRFKLLRSLEHQGAENLTSAMPCYVALYKIPKLPQPPSLASMAFQCFDDFSAIAAMYGDSTEFCCVSLEFDRFMGRTDHTLHHSGVCLQTPNLFSSFNCC